MIIPVSEKRKLQLREAYQRHKQKYPDRIKAAKERYGENHPERVKEATRKQNQKYREVNKDLLTELNKKWRIANQEYIRSKNAEYRARKLQALPTWADLSKIQEVYASCPSGYHVDHIIPLKGKNVCGLHTVENLQVIPASENLKKHNTHQESDQWL